MTGGRLKRVRRYLDDDDRSACTYGDGVATSTSAGCIAFHRDHGRAGDGDGRAAARALRRARPRRPTRGDRGFQEKPQGDGGWINGGFFVLEPEVIDYIEGDETVWEREPLERLAARRPARRLPPRRLLAADGHAARQARPGGALGTGKAPWKKW